MIGLYAGLSPAASAAATAKIGGTAATAEAVKALRSPPAATALLHLQLTLSASRSWYDLHSIALTLAGYQTVARSQCNCSHCNLPPATQ